MLGPCEEGLESSQYSSRLLKSPIHKILIGHSQSLNERPGWMTHFLFTNTDKAHIGCYG
jgi:hypothetical protein